MVYKIIEIIGRSEKDFNDAAKNAVDVANKTVKQIRWADVKGFGLVVKEGKIIEYQAKTKIAFEVMSEE